VSEVTITVVITPAPDPAVTADLALDITGAITARLGTAHIEATRAGDGLRLVVRPT
jgi:hypothetical protein